MRLFRPVAIVSPNTFNREECVVAKSTKARWMDPDGMRIKVISAAVLPAPGQRIEVRSFDRPRLERGAVLLKTLGSEVCGTDTHLAKGQLAGVPYPIIPGHVSVGIVDEVAVGTNGVPVLDVDGEPIAPGQIV